MSVSFPNQGQGYTGQNVPGHQSVTPKPVAHSKPLNGAAPGFTTPVPDKQHAQPDHRLKPAYSVRLNPGLFKSPQASYRNVVGHAPHQVPKPSSPKPRPEHGHKEIPTTPYPKPSPYPYPGPYPQPEPHPYPEPYPIPGPPEHPPPHRPTREEYRPDLQKPPPAPKLPPVDPKSIGVHGLA
ncbi:MAG: hypothetical protein QF437_04290 [Planctomycetota bacterium]|jgi:hypothetical protein|nr:hypothetical protein [Planctomycetota bacterium]MDP7129680.1 hypothetical protein [Planctomycetota bacterium]MDP7248992.1 hypothetical protein [Planctomycetota bacterium]